ncbi:ATP-dependent protease La [Corchorus olitorius]|uniref:ATP-dependent protease La n=1 Tax=Corchorus olitorius TaxID=93759 RepID=A0A1R3GNX3_9ROSI|nr:ATP-dependent protease La [Corchorus olitorius]
MEHSAAVYNLRLIWNADSSDLEPVPTISGSEMFRDLVCSYQIEDRTRSIDPGSEMFRDPVRSYQIEDRTRSIDPGNTDST